MRALLTGLLICAIAACASTPTQNKPGGITAADLVPEDQKPAPVTSTTQFYVKADWQAPVAFTGYLDKTAAQSTGGPLYAGDGGLVGLFAQIAVHAAISNSAQSKKAKAAQAKADEVLEQYLSQFEKISHLGLFKGSQQNRFNTMQYSETQPPGRDDVIIEILPAYQFSQNQKSFMLELYLSAHRPETPDDIIFEQSVKAFSKPISAEDPVAYWLQAESNPLEATVQDLYNESLTLLLEDLSKSLPETLKTQKTFKYMFNGQKRYERASLINESCNNVYARNLKGSIVVLPKISPCEKVPAATL